MSNIKACKLSTSTNTEIPLKEVKYDLDIHNNICQLTINQKYENTSTDTIETFYTFPLSDSTSVFDFSAKIGDKLIKTVIKEKEQAKNDYNTAISKGNKAFIMDQTDNSLFSVCLGNISGNSEINIEIKCIFELDTEEAPTLLRLSIPVTIMPKYSPANDTSLIKQVLDTITRVDTRPYNFQINGTITMDDGLVGVNSKTTNIKLFNFQNNSVKFNILPENLLADIILTIERKKPQTFIVCQGTNSVSPQYKYASQVNIIPDFDLVTDAEVTDMSYVIVLDQSGSMQGKAFENCKISGQAFVSLLPFGSKFNIYSFQSSFDKFSEKMEICTAETKKNACDWIDKMRCQGGTEILPVLKDIYNISKGQTTIILLTDGEVSNTSEVVKLIKNNKNINIFTIGIGSNVSESLIKQMASATARGKSEFIASDDDSMHEKVQKQLGRAQQSMMKCQENNKMTVLTAGTFIMVPEMTALYDGEVNTFYLFSEKPIESVAYTQLSVTG
jgi:Ca-activated chloride channel family protein